MLTCGVRASVPGREKKARCWLGQLGRARPLATVKGKRVGRGGPLSQREEGKSGLALGRFGWSEKRGRGREGKEIPFLLFLEIFKLGFQTYLNSF